LECENGFSEIAESRRCKRHRSLTRLVKSKLSLRNVRHRGEHEASVTEVLGAEFERRAIGRIAL
jgi:hypothetical protein